MEKRPLFPLKNDVIGKSFFANPYYFRYEKAENLLKGWQNQEGNFEIGVLKGDIFVLVEQRDFTRNPFFNWVFGVQKGNEKIAESSKNTPVRDLKKT